MLLTISTTGKNASDLSYLLHKHPGRVQSFELTFGWVRVFYPEASDEKCSVCLLLSVDPIGLVRGKHEMPGEAFAMEQYVNDRPYVCSSFLSVSIAQVFGSAMAGKCAERPEMAEMAMPFMATMAVVPCRGGETLLRRLFEPLGYSVETVRHPLDEKFPDWGESPYFNVTLRGTVKLCDLLTQLYILVPVLDDMKHYFVGPDEVSKLLEKGKAWLSGHPERQMIVDRYLRHRRPLVQDAMEKLLEGELSDPDVTQRQHAAEEEGIEGAVRLNEQRLGSVLAVLRQAGAKSVIDLGCGEGKLLRELLKEKTIGSVVGMDVSHRALEIAQKRLHIDKMAPKQAERIKLIQGSLLYRDRRLAGFDAAALIEVIEHLDAPRLAACERVVFEFARPQTVIVTTPNLEYNSKFEGLPAGKLRHKDHRFEWSRGQFHEWAEMVCTRHRYTASYVPVGPEDPAVGPPTQMAVFKREGS